MGQINNKGSFSSNFQHPRRQFPDTLQDHQPSTTTQKLYGSADRNEIHKIHDFLASQTLSQNTALGKTAKTKIVSKSKTYKGKDKECCTYPSNSEKSQQNH